MKIRCPGCREPFTLYGTTTDLCPDCLRCFMCCICPDERTPEQKQAAENILVRVFRQAGIPYEPRQFVEGRELPLPPECP